METTSRFVKTIQRLVGVLSISLVAFSWSGNASAAIFSNNETDVSTVGGTASWTAVRAVSDVQDCSPFEAADCVSGLTGGFYDPAFADYGTAPDGYAKATSTFGNNGTYAVATNQDPLFGVFAESIWSDGFTVSGGSGQGSLTLSIELDGTLSGIGANSYFLMFVSDSPITCDFTALDCTGTQVFSPVIGFSGSQTLLATIDFTYGETFYIASYLGTEVLGDGEADFYNSAKFGITAPDGNSIAGLSGTAYELAAVPEPATIALLGLGLAGFAVARRRKR